MPLEATMRASEIVQDYLKREFLFADREEARLPTIKNIAAHLNVSHSTVRSVVRKFVAEGQLQTTQGRGTFLKARGKKNGVPLLLGTNMMTFNPNHAPNWSETIYLGAMRMAATMPRDISLMPVMSAASASPEKIQQELLKRMDQIDMLMLFPLENNERVRRVYEEAGKPVVEINPTAIDATANFVSSDYFEAGVRVGKAWYETGRRNILFIGNPSSSVSVSSHLLLVGLADGCRRDLDPEVRFRVVPANDETEVRETLYRLLRDGSPAPDAILCAGDIMGLEALEILGALGLNVPNDVSVVAGTGYLGPQHSYHDLTRIMQPMDQLGANAVRILFHRLENQCVLVPGLFLSAPVNEGKTTRLEENLILKSTLGTCT